jgi:hypothetical protein
LVAKEDGMSFLRRRVAGKQLNSSSSPGQGIRLANGPA